MQMYGDFEIVHEVWVGKIVTLDFSQGDRTN